MRFGTDKKLFLILTLIFVGIANACSQSKEEKMKLANEHSEQALKLRMGGDVKGAIREQSAAVELNPDDPQLLVNLIGFYRDDENLAKAKETAENALKLIPENAWVNSLYGEILEREDNNQEALKYRKRAVELEPNNPLFVSHLASVQETLNDRKSAKENFYKALELDPNFVFALLRVGQIEEEEGNIKKAVELYNKVLTVSPKDYEVGDEAFVEEAKRMLNKMDSKKNFEK